MKLCNYRRPRNGEGSCLLTTNQLRGEPFRWGATLVFRRGDESSSWYTTDCYRCTEAMSAVCPYRVHTPNPRLTQPAKPNPRCRRCKIRHRTKVAKEFCKAKGRFEKALCPWSEKGSSENIWSTERLRNQYHWMLWPWVVSEIANRDDRKCQDCGREESYQYREHLECHHIIPRGLGGKEHPANLKTVCRECHQKYGKLFNKKIRRLKKGKNLKNQSNLEES